MSRWSPCRGRSLLSVGLLCAAVRGVCSVEEACDAGEDGTCASKTQPECGGWGCFDKEKVPAEVASRRGEFNFCDVPIFAAEEVPADLFGDLTWLHRPFILRGDRATLAMQELFDKQNLMDIAQERLLTADIGYSWDIVLGSGTGPKSASLHEFLRKTMHEDNFDGEHLLERPYLFGAHTELTRYLDVVVPVHPFIRSFSNSSFKEEHHEVSLVLIGGIGSGVGFHRHAAAIQTTLHGNKRWLLYPPTGNPPGGMKGDWPIYDWLHEVYPSLVGDQAPVECIQQPGDVLYIPEGWYHAVLNLADTVALSTQLDKFTNKSMRYTKKFRDTKNATKRIALARKAAKLARSSMEVKVDLFVALQNDDKQQEAYDVISEVAQSDPLFVFAQNEVFITMKKLKRMEGILPTLTEFKPHLERNPRSLNANLLLSYFYLLSNDKVKALEYLRRNEHLQHIGVTRQDAANFKDMADNLAKS